MVTKVGISNEVALGASITHTWYWSISPTVPGYHKLVVEWGSEGGSGYGKEVYFLDRVPTDSWSVTGNWTSNRYVEWWYEPL